MNCPKCNSAEFKTLRMAPFDAPGPRRPVNLVLEIGFKVAYWIAFVAFPIGSVYQMFNNWSFLTSIFHGILIALLVFISVFMLFYALSVAFGFRKRQAKKMESWEKTWICLACGHQEEIEL